MPRRLAPSLVAALSCAALCAWAEAATAQVADLDLRTTVFAEPSRESRMTVITPAAALGVIATDWLRLDAAWQADIVSGASEAVKAGPLAVNPDIVSGATVHDVRHTVSGGVRLTREATTLSAHYSYGIERDYRSSALTVSAATDFFQRNTQMVISYAHGFDAVCDAANPVTRDPTARVALDSSKGCFTSAADRSARDVDLDSFQGAWTQSWTPVFATQLTLTGELQHGFLGNPYRSVVVGATGQSAQEHHPDNRARGAAALRARYYLRPIKTAFGVGVRAYRDTWDVLSQTYELDAERYLAPWLRLQLRGRYYRQTGALFWSDDYTGGEPENGPRGQYWTGDRELSPLHSYLVGGRAVASWHGIPGDRVGGALLALETSVSLDLVKTTLEQFTWAGREPDDTLAMVFGLGLGGAF